MADTDPNQTTGAATPTQTTGTTAATTPTEAPQIVRIAEAELPTATAAQVAEIRVIDNEGNSKTMTLAEARKALALAPSLTEQLVPGEFWLGTDGVSRQVYQRSFVGTIPALMPAYSTLDLIVNGGVFSITSVDGYTNTGVNNFSIDPSNFVTNQNTGSMGWHLSDAASLLGRPYGLLITYTKK